MERPAQQPSPDDSWDEVRLDDDFVVSAAFTEAPGLERIARARFSAHKEPLAPKPATVPVIGVSPRHPHLASRLVGTALAAALVATGGYVALRAPGVTSPATTLVMGSGQPPGGQQGSGQPGSQQSNAARPGTSADSYTPPQAGSDRAAAADRNGEPARRSAGSTGTATVSQQPAATPGASALPLQSPLTLVASGTPTPMASATVSPDPSASPDASGSPSPDPSASPTGSPSPTAPGPSATATPSPMRMPSSHLRVSARFARERVPHHQAF